MGVGNYDRSITIKTLAVTNNSGDRDKTETTFATLSAMVKPGSASETMEQGRQQSRINSVYVTRYYPGIVAKMLLVDNLEGNTYEIHGVRVLGRKEQLEIHAAWHS